MQIVFVTTSFFPARGGVERHTLKLGLELLKRGHQLTVLTPQTNSTRPSETVDDINVIRFKYRPFVTAWFSLWKQRHVLRQADVIHLHDFFSYLWVWPFLRRPFFVTFHGWEGRVPPHPFVVKLRRMIERRSRGSIVIGRFLEKWYQQRPTIVLYGGVEAPATAPINKTLNSSQLHFTWLGRLATDTDPLKALEFFKLVHQRFPGSRLDLLGDGPLAGAAQDYVAQYQLPVTFHGFVTDPQPFLERSDVTLVSGYLGIMDALAAGSIVVSFYGNELKRDYLELSPFAQLAVIGSKPDEVMNSFTQLIDHPEQVTKLKVDSRAFIEQHSWQHVADAYERLWTKTP